jgi:general secretion pathway protein D
VKIRRSISFLVFVVMTGALGAQQRPQPQGQRLPPRRVAPRPAMPAPVQPAQAAPPGTPVQAAPAPPAQTAPAQPDQSPQPAQSQPFQQVQPAQPGQSAQPAQPAASTVRIGNLSLRNASLTEVIDQLARQLHINYILDPAVKGGVILNTYGDTSNLDTRNLLELILRINGAGLIQEGDIYRIVQLKDAPKIPIPPQINARDIPEDDQIMLNLVFLKYVTVDELSKVLGQFVGENATMYSYTPMNLLFILDSRRNMRRTMELISLFDSDTFANERVRLFEVKNTRPSDLVKDLENVLKAISLDAKNLTVRFLPVDRINTLIAVAPNPGVFDTIAQWIGKLDIPVKVTAGGSSENHVYRVRYGRAECIALALTELFGVYGYGGYGSLGAGYGAGYGPGYGGYGGYGTAGVAPVAGPFGSAYGGGYGASPSSMSGSYGNSNSFNGSFGGSGGCAAGAGGGFGGSYGGAGYGGAGYGGGYGAGPAYGYPVFGGFAAQVPAANAAGPFGLSGAAPQPPGAAAAPAASGATSPSAPPPTPVRIVPNPLDNALIIQADAQQYQDILKLLKDLDIPPRQILLEARIYSVALSGSFVAGVSAQFQKVSGKDRSLLGSLTNTAGVAGAALSFGALVGQSRELLAFLNLSENASRVTVLSEPSLIATDSIPATITVGSQVPVETSAATTVAGATTTTTGISSHNTGVTMQVNARVNPSGVVTLIVNQEVSKPSGDTSGLTPSFDQQVVQTQITLQDGDTIAIGGIISESNTTASNGLPGLNRLPLIGGLFGNKNYSHDRSELIIFMTPHVIFDESGLIEASNELKDRVKKLRKYVKEL